MFLRFLFLLFAAFQATGAFTWDGRYHAAFDKGWGDGRRWVWSSPHEPLWRARTGPWPFPKQ